MADEHAKSLPGEKGLQVLGGDGKSHLPRGVFPHQLQVSVSTLLYRDHLAVLKLQVRVRLQEGGGQVQLLSLVSPTDGWRKALQVKCLRDSFLMKG